MKRLVLALVLAAVPVLADHHLHFDPVNELPFMDCSYNATRAAGCLSGNFSANDTEMDSTDFITSNSWCNNSRGYYTFNGTDSISYDNVSSLYNITNLSIVVGFTGTNVSRFGGIVSNTANVSFANSTGGAFSMNSSVSFTADAPAPVDGGGSTGGGGGGGGGSSGITPVKACTPNWFCSDWTTCLSGEQARECLDLQGCGTNYLKPEDIRTCTSAVIEEPVHVIEPFTPSFRPRHVFYISKWLMVIGLLALGVVISHSHFLLKLRSDPVRKYVLLARAHGASDRAIRMQLKKAGWKDYAIEEGIKK